MPDHPEWMKERAGTAMGKESIDLANLKIAEMREYGLKSQWVHRATTENQGQVDHRFVFRRLASDFGEKFRGLTISMSIARIRAMLRPALMDYRPGIFHGGRK